MSDDATPTTPIPEQPDAIAGAPPDGASATPVAEDDRPRRSKSREAPEIPAGYRSTRRGSKAAKSAKKAMRQHKIVTAVDRAGREARNIGQLLLLGVGGVLVLLLVLYLGVNAWNWLARWNAERAAPTASVDTERERQARENLLVIGEREGKAAGFLAMRIDEKGRQAFGVAVPDGAFIEVPGQGFERIGDSYLAGADVSMSAISNFFTVPFRRYVVVPESAYQESLRAQSVRDLMSQVTTSNLTAAEEGRLTRALDKLESENVALVPLQVKPISLGSQTYYEPQREELADLLESWWGVKLSDAQTTTRVIVYNGAGTPGIAGEAAQQLIRGGLRVVDTKNADKFDYAQTQIVVQNKDVTAGEKVRKVLGVGTVVNQPAEQNVADVIVIIGKDYKPPSN